MILFNKPYLTGGWQGRRIKIIYDAYLQRFLIPLLSIRNDSVIPNAVRNPIILMRRPVGGWLVVVAKKK